MSISSYNPGVPLGSVYSNALTRPRNSESFIIRNGDVTFKPFIPKEVNSKLYNITSNSTVYIPSANTYIDCGNFNTIRNEIKNITYERVGAGNVGITANANIIQKFYFTPDDKKNEFEYITRFLENGDQLVDTIPIKSQKFRMELINANTDNVSNASVYVNDTLLWYSQFNTHSHIHEVTNNPVNLNTAQNNMYYDDLTLNRVKNATYKSIRGYMDHATGSSIQCFWNTDIRYLSFPSAFNLDLVSDSTLDSNLTVKVEGLNALGDEIDETIQLDGTNTVTSTKQFLRVNKASAFIDQETGSFDYQLNNGNITMYQSGGALSSIQEFIDAVRSESNTVKYAVPRNKQVIIKDINIDGVVGNYSPEVDIFVNNNIIAGTGKNIFAKVFTARFEDNQNISQHYTNLNIKIDELQEFYMEFNPKGASKQNTFITIQLNYVEYPKPNYYKN